MSHHHKYSSSSRDRPVSFSSSSSFYKDYHSSDPHVSKRRSDGSSGGSKHYSTSSTSYSADRPYEEKKHHHGHSSSSSSYHSYSSSSSHHRQPYEKHSSSAIGGSHHGEHHHHSSASSGRYKSYDGVGGNGSSSAYLPPPPPPVLGRVIRKVVRPEFRKYERVLTSTSGVRRIPPPLSPPPLMKIATSASSRYRQAPPEDRNHPRTHRTSERVPRIRVSSTARERVRPVLETKKVRKPTELPEKLKAPKRSAVVAVVNNESDKRPSKKKKEDEKGNGEGVQKPVADTEIRGTKEESKKQKSEKRSSGDVKIQKKEKGKGEVGDDVESDGKEKPLLKLCCTYCDFRCISFRDFSIHTRSFLHGKIMSNVIDESRAKLISLKHAIRDQQKDLEKSLDEQKTLADTTSYCRVCEINLRTDPKEHEANEIHNDIKGLVDRKCELCHVDFRLWKVYLFHTVSLEHVKRVALKEMKEREGEKDALKGTNMTTAELGLDLLEEKHVIFCKACVRYFPIREGNFEESRLRHCMAVNHIKFVEDYTGRMKYIAKRDAEEKAKNEAKLLAKKAKEDEAVGISEGEKTTETSDETPNVKNEGESSDVKVEEKEEGVENDEIEAPKRDDEGKDEEMEEDVSQSQNNQLEDSQEEEVEEEHIEPEVEQEEEDDEPDEDEIQLHADEDDEVDAPVEDD